MEETFLRVRGLVQGVGFRPFVHRTASRLGLRGWVRNDPQGVLIRVSGKTTALGNFRQALWTEAPAAARVEAVESAVLAAAAELPLAGFEILESVETGATDVAIPTDLALCADCRRELLDPLDRRFRYPFINCTQCGPRYSILKCLPYDRAHTTMQEFPMCRRCQAEYNDPESRRFHAQPNACWDCGPIVTFAEGDTRQSGETALRHARAVLVSGGILAVKGIGGYHLFADATSERAVAELRRRKHREEKPFAVMFAHLAAASSAVVFTDDEAALLGSPAAPIVLLPRREGSPLAPSVAPNNPWIGAFLAHAPLQVLLLESLGRPVIATSANLAEEPLCVSEQEAVERLAGIADAFLHHNRPIEHPVDDSLLRSVGKSETVMLRRGRGYAPTGLTLPGRMDGAWLCTGAQMKSTVAVATDNHLVLSPHIGNLESPATCAAYERTIGVLRGISKREFTGVVCDRHPDYVSTRFAEKTGLPRIAVQHHLAHVLSCLLEHGKEADDVLGVAWDGTGWGEDGTIWGGEFLLLRRNQAVRFARLRPFRLAGGEAAIRDGRRVALGLAHAAGGEGFEALARRLRFSSAELAVLNAMLDRGVNSPLTSSMGRLFDAAGVLLGLADHNRFEGQIPLALEAAAVAAGEPRPSCPFPLRAVVPGGGAEWEIDWEPGFEALRRHPGGDRGEWAAAFHHGLAEAIVAVAQAARTGTVALSGGCFQNTFLLRLATTALRRAGFTVLTHRQLPPNDGGIAAGQALGALWGLSSVHLP